MYNKLIAGSMTAALLFGGAFQNTADASVSAENSENHSYQQQVFYSINGSNWSEHSSSQFDNYVRKYFPQISWNWDESKDSSKQEKQDQPKQTEPEQDKPEQNQKQDKPEQSQEKPEQDKPEQNQEQPKTDDQPEEQRDKSNEQTTDKQPEEKPESQAPTQQPTEQQEKQQNSSQSQQLNEFEQQVVELTNQERTAQGLEPLKVDTELSKVAREKSRDMATSNYFSHNSPNYGSPFDMMKQFGVSYKTAGENIARGQRTPQEVVDGWMNSEGHRKNIMNPDFTHIGVGYVEQGNHWTQQFIGK
ncbi:hypothetical protein EU245_07080 [Lentibacillus lipolyticus]|nr:hypothetical protein EU245_07080 [Lentibacillus lipolyticus]